jgi:hypothetical protein
MLADFLFILKLRHKYRKAGLDFGFGLLGASRLLKKLCLRIQYSLLLGALTLRARQKSKSKFIYFSKANVAINSLNRSHTMVLLGSPLHSTVKCNKFQIFKKC